MGAVERVEKHPRWRAVKAFTAGFVSAVAIVAIFMLVTGRDPVRKGTYLLISIVAENYISRAELDQKYILRSDYQSEPANLAKWRGAQTTSASPTPYQPTSTPTNEPMTSARTTSPNLPPDEALPAKPHVETDAYRLTVMSVSKDAGDSLTLILRAETTMKEPIKFAMEFPPYLLDDSGGRWDCGNQKDTASLVVDQRSQEFVELIPGVSITSRVSFALATTSSSKNTFTFFAKERSPTEGRSIVINGLRLDRRAPVL